MEADKTEEGNVVFRFLLELVLGQWNAVPEELVMQDEKNTTLQLARLLSDELRALIFHNAFVNPRKQYRFTRQCLFILDKDFLIRAMGSETASFLATSEVSLYKSDFTGYLTTESQKKFVNAVNLLQKDDRPHFIVQHLQFLDANGAIVMGDCHIDLLLYAKYSLTVTLFALRPLALERIGTSASRPDKNLVAVQQVYDFVRAHKEGALPSAHAFARQFGTNEYELKKEFKKRFGTSIYQLYTLVRLERADELICGTNLSLAEIAQQSGFDDYSGFAKAYRKQFGNSPAKRRADNRRNNS